MIPDDCREDGYGWGWGGRVAEPRDAAARAAGPSPWSVPNEDDR